MSIVSTLQNSLRDLTSYAGGIGSIHSLTDLGLELGQDGKLSLNSAKFDTATANGTDAILSFLGDSSSGFLKAANDNLKTVEDPINGTIQTAIQSTQQQITAQDKLIQANQDRVSQIKENLQAQMAASDALVASLEQQVNYMTNLFESMKLNSESYR